MNMQTVYGYLRILAGFAVLWAGFFAWNTIGCRRIEGSEMEPTLKKDKAPLINPKVRSAAELNTGDFVSYLVLQGTKERVAAGRVVALPGDRVRIEKGEVLVNGSKVDSNYVQANQKSPEDNFAEIVVPREHVYVLGDSRRVALSQKIDSRSVGPVGQWALFGKFR